MIDWRRPIFTALGLALMATGLACSEVSDDSVWNLGEGDLPDEATTPCPTPIIEASATEGDVVWSDEEEVLDAEVLDRVTLAAEAGLDSDDGAIGEVQWSLLEWPADSRAHFEGGADTEETELFLDMVGTYVVELDIKSDGGQWACEPARLTVIAGASADILVHLVWDTPGDPDRNNDHGTDMDLHFLHPDGQWGEAPWDCHWRSPSPVWNEEGSEGNPTLDSDVSQGWGPENISLDHPDDSLEYAVGVNYFTDRGFGESVATLRVYLEGQLATEIESPSLEPGEFWDVLRIDGGLDESVIVDHVYEDIDEAAGSASSLLLN